MKKILNCGMKFLLVLFVGMTAISCSNNNDSILEPQPEENPLPDEDITSWTFCVEGKQWDGVAWNERGDFPFSYILKGDTIISGKKCKKVYHQYERMYFNTQYHYCAALREEGDKVYLIQKDDTTLKLLYDFSLKEGDEFHYIDSKDVVEKVVAIQEIVSQNEVVRLFVFEELFLSGFQEHQRGYVMEGVGGLRSPIDPWGWSRDGIVKRVLKCTVNGQVLYEGKKTIDSPLSDRQDG